MNKSITVQSRPRLLLVEDDEISSALIEHILGAKGYDITTATDGQTAQAILKAIGQEFSAILLDRELPRLDGMALLEWIKNQPELKRIPVIMETGIDDIEQVWRGIAAGAHYYLVKPLQRELLVTIVAAAVAQYQEIQQMSAAERRAESFLGHLRSGLFHYRTLDEAHLMARSLSWAFPDPSRVALGLQELMINAVEHGNLGISYDEKTRLTLSEQWLEEVQRRQDLECNRDKRVEVTLQRQPGRVVVTIRDQGAGFDWRSYLDFAPQRAFDPHGRGIAMARAFSFDTLEYQGCGNSVTVTVDTP